jgi:pimeloyl-ACP methyl ester carboxylesterase
MRDLVAEALAGVAERPVVRRELRRDRGRTLRWVELGAGPRVVLVAGSGEMALDWATVMPGLADAARVIAYDRAGSGASDPLPHLSVEAEIEDLAALLASTGPAVVVGHSWGGLLVQLTAMQHPELFRGMVLVDASHETVLGSVPRHWRLVERGMGVAVVTLDRCGLFQRLARGQGRKLAESTTDDPALRGLVVEAYLDSYSRRHQVAMIRDEARLSDHAVAWIRGRRAEASLPDVPLVALSATRKPESIRRLSMAATTGVCASVPRGRHVVLESGHYIHHDRPAAVIEAVTDVLRAQGGRGTER